VKTELQNIKIELIQWLSTLEDVDTIQQLIDIKAKENADWWDTLSDSEKKSIEQGLADAKEGKLKPHSDALDIYGKWL
jgi:predicted transcriptional regulator